MQENLSKKIFDSNQLADSWFSRMTKILKVLLNIFETSREEVWIFN